MKFIEEVFVKKDKKCEKSKSMVHVTEILYNKKLRVSYSGIRIKLMPDNFMQNFFNFCVGKKRKINPTILNNIRST